MDSKDENLKTNNFVSSLFWGLLLIIIGCLFLAENFGFTQINWDGLWRLWPLLIIYTGLSMITVKNVIWKVFLPILMIASLVFVVYVAASDFSVNTNIKISNATTK